MRYTYLLVGALLSVMPLSAQEMIDMGDTPWRFSKIVRTDANLAPKSLVSVGPRSVSELTDGDKTRDWAPDAAVPLTIDLHDPCRLASVTLHYAGDAVTSASVEIEGSLDGVTWTRLSDGGVSRPCVANKTNDLAAVGETFGYVERITDTSLTVSVDGEYRLLRVKSPRPFSEIVVNPVAGDDGFSPSQLSAAAFDDSGWEQVGIPHCYNERDTYLNSTKGELCWRGEAWYRKKIKISRSDRGKQLFLRFNGVNIGMTLYVNGHPVNMTTSAVQQPSDVTHVGSSIPFAVNITPYVEWGKENQIAVRVSNSRDTFFTYPEFAENEGFGQAMGGIVSPVWLCAKSDVYIPFNTYAPHGKWGTYFGTVSATPSQAVLRFVTRVENTSAKDRDVRLVTALKDKEGKTVFSRAATRRVAAGETGQFDFSGPLDNPVLWYPVGSPSGGPYLYTVENSVYVDGKLKDRVVEKMGIRTVTWDKNYCYINGEKTILRGFGYRNSYPGLGAAVPVAMRWDDVKRIADCGGNTFRVGHQPPFYEAVEACDEYGVMLILNSGDNEWALKNEPACTYKQEYDRDAVIAFRNHPSVIVWESNNGLARDGERYLPSRTLAEVKKHDFIAPRIVLNRDGYPPEWDEAENVVVGYTNWYWKDDRAPSINTEVYGTNWNGDPSFCIARDDYDNEVKFSQYYVENYLDNLDNRACGWIDWMLAETYGEGYTIYLNGRRDQKSLGSCAMDGSRIPKLKYRIYRDALWNSYDRHPGVALQSHWNYSGVVDVNAWSNCPRVELFLNGCSLGTVTPDSRTRRCVWKDVAWEPGTIEAVGLDADGNPVCRESAVTAGDPYAVEVTVEPNSSTPSGTAFPLRANGSDAVVVTARVVDKDGNWCPRADNLLRFDVSGEGVYKGGYNFYITDGQDMGYHAPGDPELQAEGGLIRAAVRTTFTPGPITVTVTSPGLKPGMATVKSVKK